MDSNTVNGFKYVLVPPIKEEWLTNIGNFLVLNDFSYFSSLVYWITMNFSIHITYTKANILIENDFDMLNRPF